MQRRNPAPPKPDTPKPTYSFAARSQQFLQSIQAYRALPSLFVEKTDTSPSEQHPIIVLSEHNRTLQKVFSFLDGTVPPSDPSTPPVPMTTPRPGIAREFSSTSEELTPREQLMRPAFEGSTTQIFDNDGALPLPPVAAAFRTQRHPRTSLSRMMSGASLIESVGSFHTVVVPCQKRRYYSIFQPDKEALLLEKIHQAAGENYFINIDKGFIWFTHKAADISEDRLDVKGVKFHVSLSHIEEKYRKGVLIVLEELLKFNHPHFKIVHPSFLSQEVYDEAGREVTIYAYMVRQIIENGQFCSSYSKLLRTITERLNKGHVPPYIDSSDRVVPPVKDTIIPELLRITWRNDRCGYLSTSVPNQAIVELCQDEDDEENTALAAMSS